MKTRNKIGLVAAHGILLACFVIPSLALADTPAASTQANTQTQTAAPVTTDTTGVGPFVPLTHLPQIDQLAQSQGFATFVNTLYKICIGAGAVLAVLMIMYAGFEIMKSTGSISANEKAKNRIQNAVFGLILVLAPTIVFGIINPDILNLNLGTEFGSLKQDQGINQAAFNSPTQESALPTNCTDYTDQTAKPVLDSCTAPAIKVTAACCSITDTSSGICCARPKTTAATAATQYEWKITYTPPSTASQLELGTAPSPVTKQGGPFTTQQACADDYAAFTTVSNPPSNATQQCNCSKPRSEFPACSQ